MLRNAAKLNRMTSNKMNMWIEIITVMMACVRNQLRESS